MIDKQVWTGLQVVMQVRSLADTAVADMAQHLTAFDVLAFLNCD